MKVLVTGSLGLTGKACVQACLKKGWKVVGIDSNMRAKFFNTLTEKHTEGDYYDIDIRDKEGLVELFKKYNFDAIIHTAAQPSHDWSKSHVLEDFEINALGTLNLLETARHYSPKAVFVHCSTDKIYGHGMRRDAFTELSTRYDHPDLFDEDTPCEAPFSPFGAGKLAAEAYVQEYAAQGWLRTGAFRMGCITGKNHQGAEQHGFLAYLAKCIKEEQPYAIFGFKGKQVRDQIHANDLAQAFIHFIENPRNGEVYNIGGGRERSVSVLEAIDMLEKKCGHKALITILAEPRFGDRIWDIHDVSKFRKDYPKWEYQYSLDDIIADLCS